MAFAGSSKRDLENFHFRELLISRPLDRQLPVMAGMMVGASKVGFAGGGRVGDMGHRKVFTFALSHMVLGQQKSP